MRATTFLGESLADDATMLDDDAADKRIRRRDRAPLLGHLNGARHHGVVERTEHSVGHFVTSRIACLKSSTSEKLR